MIPAPPRGPSLRVRQGYRIWVYPAPGVRRSKSQIVGFSSPSATTLHPPHPASLCSATFSPLGRRGYGGPAGDLLSPRGEGGEGEARAG